MRIVTPLRFVSGVIGLWIAARVAILLPGVAPPPATPAKAGAYSARDQARRPEKAERLIPVFAGMTDRGGAGSSTPLSLGDRRAFRASRSLSSAVDSFALMASTSPVPQNSVPREVEAGRQPIDSGLSTPAAAAAAPATSSPTGIVAITRSPSSRWSGGLYLFHRSDTGTPALATGGQLGGSQAGGRIAYRLNSTGSTRFAAAARLSTPLNDRHGAEAAAGLDWHPLPAAPLRLSVERRIDLGGAGRNAWSAYAAGGFWRQTGRIVIDGYAQAGIVGARRRDLFADGALRAGHRTELGAGRSLTVGAGGWAAAQPGVERLDLGPRVALGLPLAGTAATLAAEWRPRIAGDAAPRSGLAITLAADF